MKEIYDEDIKLKLLLYSKEDFEDEKTFEIYQNFINQLNTWSEDKNIQKYICSDMDLGDFLSCITKNSTSYKSELIHKHLIVFDGEKLVGTALLTINDFCLKDHIIKYCKQKNTKDDNNPLLSIEYIATNPYFRNKGFATKIIRGIKNNERNISDNIINYGISAVIQNENKGSKKAFLKNKFVCTPAKSCSKVEDDFKVYYFVRPMKDFLDSKEI